MMEHVIHSCVMKYLNKHEILVHYQHGFRAGHSCETQLITTIDEVVRNLDQKSQTDMIILDFSKAFDTVPHKRLIEKLKSYNIDETTIKWIQSWLSARSQTVVVDGQQSRPSNVISGVPQGTVLGPLLFLLYINDIALTTDATIKLFADDCILFRKVHSPNDCRQLQDDLDKLVDWSEKWLMNFNVRKCVTMTLTKNKSIVRPSVPYNIRSQPLDQVKEAKYLGITISSDLSWKPHICEITNKASNTLAFLRRNFSRTKPAIKEKLYTTLVRPQMEYASAVWDPHIQVNINKLESVQRRAARFAMCKYSYHESVSDMLEKLKWPELSERRKTNRINHFTRARDNTSALKIPDYIKPSTRHDHCFIVPSSRTNIHKHSFFPQTVRDWNNLQQGRSTRARQ